MKSEELKSADELEQSVGSQRFWGGQNARARSPPLPLSC